MLLKCKGPLVNKPWSLNPAALCHDAHIRVPDGPCEGDSGHLCLVPKYQCRRLIFLGGKGWQRETCRYEGPRAAQCEDGARQRAVERWGREQASVQARRFGCAKKRGGGKEGVMRHGEWWDMDEARRGRGLP